MSKNNGHDPAISVVVPVKNEAGNITPLVAEIAAALHGHAFEIVYVNDGSSDATEQELLGLMAQRPWLRQIRHESPTVSRQPCAPASPWLVRPLS